MKKIVVSFVLLLMFFVTGCTSNQVKSVDKIEIIGSNGVHQIYNGYMQIGDAFFRSLVNDFKEN